MKKIIKNPFTQSKIDDLNALAGMATDIANTVRKQNEDLFELIDAHYDVESASEYKEKIIKQEQRRELMRRFGEIWNGR